MATQRPRPSILSLFDPLSSPDSDKENDCSETSFFHGFSKQVYSPVHKLRRRLIDIGEVTIDEPDIKDLLEDEEELEAEINQSVAVEEEENATLTFRDMAKAATPKWSARHGVRGDTPKSSPVPRTPLAEIVVKDETTPMARKKMFKRPIGSKASQLYIVNTAKDTPLSAVDHPGTSTTSVPCIEISCCDTEECQTSGSSQASMGNSTATLEIPTPSCTLMSDTPIPVFISPSSSQSGQASAVSPQLAEARLRPNAHLSESSNLHRHSVDLHSSFQLHFSSSETTFDLLNDKISFFGSKNSLEASFVYDAAVSDDDDDWSKTEIANESIPKGQITTPSETTEITQRFDDTEETNLENQDKSVTKVLQSMKAKHTVIDVKNQTHSIPVRKGSPISLATQEGTDSVEDVPRAPEKAESDVLSTPNPSHPVLYPPQPVPALRIVKRTKTLEAKALERKSIPGSSGRPSCVKTSISASRATKRPSITTSNMSENGDQSKTTGRVTAPIVVKDPQSGDGPRRVMVTEGPKVKTIVSTKTQSKPASGIGGRRRIAASETTTNIGPTMRSNAVNKSRAVSAAGASGIPKPISRNVGSKIPAPPSNGHLKQRFGVQ